LPPNDMGGRARSRKRGAEEEKDEDEDDLNHRRGSDDADAVRHVERVVILGQAHVGLLPAVGPDEGAHLGALHVIHLLHGLFDLALGRLDVHQKDEC